VGAGEVKQIGAEAAALGKKALLVSYADCGFMKETLDKVVALCMEKGVTAVATNAETMEKTYLFHPCIYPKVSILDAELTTSLPAYQPACGVVGSLSHDH
jgi:alcohol dehydrogenase class IV